MNDFNQISFRVTAVIVIIIGSASSNIKNEFLSATSQSETVLKEEIVLNALFNTTDFNYPFYPFLRNESTRSEGGLFQRDDRYFSKNGTESGAATYEDNGYKPTLTHLTNYLFSSIPPFDLSSLEGISEKCRKDSFYYIQNLRNLKLWALKMYDASAKLPSGFLSGNINQLGDFDLCLSVNAEDWDIKGQYCLPSLQIETPNNFYLSSLHDLIHSHYILRSQLQDPGHRVPRFSSINWALCVPHSCTPKDVEIGLQKTINTIFNETNFDIRYEMDPAMCQHSDSKPVPVSTILASAFFASIILLAIFATLYDFQGGEKNELLLAFSFRKTLSSLLSTKRSTNDIQAVHGIRCVNAIMLLLAHKSMAVFFIPYTNRTAMSEFLGRPWTVIGRAASLYTDPFIMISGTLTAYSLYGKLQRNNKINIFEEYITRVFRIVPTLGALIIFCTFVLPWLSSGPQWNLVVTHHAENCKRYWWRNMLFIHNYFGFKDMCLTHTHHVGIDTQLFLLSPLMVLTIWKWKGRGILALVTLALISTIMRYYVTYSKKLSNYIHYGTSIEQLFNTADNMYILPAHRVTVYVMGILLGCSLQYWKNIKFSALQLHIGNIIALASFCASFFGPAFMGSIDYVYNPIHAAWYAAFAPILWCTAFIWIIYTTHNGQTTVFGRIFSWKGFLIWTRISYAVYLTQFPTFFYNVGVTRTAEEYTFVRKMFDIPENAWIIILSVVLTILFETPFQTIKNIVFKRKSRKTKIEIEQKIK